MAKIEISITRALTICKRLEERIAAASNLPFVGIQKGTDDRAEVYGLGSKTIEDAKKMYKANFDSVSSLLKQRDEITAAIVKSNALTTITIGGKTIPVAVAIERKKSISFEENLVRALTQQISTHSTTVTRGNNDVEARIDSQVTQFLSKDKSKPPTAEQRQEIAGPIERSNKLSLIDPNDLHNLTAKMITDLGDFKSQVDFLLAESNARTMIEIEDDQPVVTKASTDQPQVAVSALT